TRPWPGTGEQIIVEVKQLRHQPDAGWDRSANIVAASGVEKPLVDLSPPTQPDINSLIRVLCPPNSHYARAWKTCSAASAIRSSVKCGPGPLEMIGLGVAAR